MKKAVIAFIISLGGTAAYAGNTEKWTLNDKGDAYNVVRNKATLFINDSSGQFDIEHAVLNKFGLGLPFTLKTN